ncbi:inactive peptidyl-prolyl cis-trans isomerase shutdown-like [Teleopsis dalmanni]|uniref:inactive peptidyl-prolyl cis-trans isomerase shutdown-like n=2 Tax=Teleopsis dalmanni TaxID=139649 RepID=UPI0018CD60D4|nr:inactive peptidyl-prolyl cis-trans isomerase shutdown-like [Teleopsis dalmanni]XP_037954505.1 inactive peptidyl-prolyl cis-trans isomerase shutdown-like [Teleopsis dalmanni]
MELNNAVEESCTVLKDPISLVQLLSDGANFEISTNADEYENNMFDELNIGSDDENEDSETIISQFPSPWTQPFAELKQDMVKISDDIHKKITAVGCKEKGLVPDNARVCIKYNAYWEGDSVPFDSSFLRGAKFTFYTGQCEVLSGLEKAVQSMYQGESATFIIHYNLLFHEMGCPPRVKPKADGLFIIDVISFDLIGNLTADMSIKPEDRNKYTIVVEKVKDIHLRGLDFFKQQMYRNAISAFQRAANVLSYCSLQNEDEERGQKLFLIKLYTNLAVCFNKVGDPKKACIMCREVRNLDKQKPSCKILFQEGKALRMLGEYERARNILAKSLLLEPMNPEINAELKLLNEQYEQWQHQEKNIWTKALGMQLKEKSKNDVETTNRDQWEEIIKNFKTKSNLNDFKLPTYLSNDDMTLINELAEQFELKVRVSTLNNTRTLSRK